MTVMAVTDQNWRVVLRLLAPLLASVLGVVVVLVVLASCSMEARPASAEPAAEAPEAPDTTPEPTEPVNPGPSTPAPPPSTPPPPTTPPPPSTPPPPTTPPPPSTPPPPPTPVGPTVEISSYSGESGGTVTFERTGDTSSTLTFRFQRCGPYSSGSCGDHTDVTQTFPTGQDSFVYSIGGQANEAFSFVLLSPRKCSACDAYVLGTQITLYLSVDSP